MLFCLASSLRLSFSILLVSISILATLAIPDGSSLFTIRCFRSGFSGLIAKALARRPTRSCYDDNHRKRKTIRVSCCKHHQDGRCTKVTSRTLPLHLSGLSPNPSTYLNGNAQLFIGIGTRPGKTCLPVLAVAHTVAGRLLERPSERAATLWHCGNDKPARYNNIVNSYRIILKINGR